MRTQSPNTPISILHVCTGRSQYGLLWVTVGDCMKKRITWSARCIYDIRCDPLKNSDDKNSDVADGRMCYWVESCRYSVKA